MCKEKYEGVGGVSRYRIDDVAPLLLKGIFVATTFLSIMMVFWILVLPSSWLVGFSETHDNFIRYFLPEDETQVSPRVILKYGGHPLIKACHILPGAVWSGSIPFQLHPGFRKINRSLHRKIGYIFLGTSILMSFGIYLIVSRGLTFENDYPNVSKQTKFEEISLKLIFPLMTSWFVFTAIMAVVKARSKDFVSHKKYIYRHIASGLWVAIQRLIVIFSGPQKDAQHMRQLFGRSGEIGYLITFGFAELSIFLETRYNQQKMTVKVD